MNAYDELLDAMESGEEVEAIVFGPWGWGSAPDAGKEWNLAYGEPETPPIPFDVRGRVLTLEEAAPMMVGWQFDGGYGAPDCYACRIWTNRRVLWVTQYDGATTLDSAPRHPIAHMPDMPGG